MKKNILILVLTSVLVLVLIYTRNTVQDRKSNVSVTTSDTTVSLTSPTEKDSNKETLNLSGQGLEKLPAYVLTKTSLEELDISNNGLTGALPAEIRYLSNLKVLNVSNNKMTGVPAEIGQLEKLEVLNLANNELTGLPYEMGNLKNLKVLNLSGNNYSKQDLEKIKQDLPFDVEIIY